MSCSIVAKLFLRFLRALLRSKASVGSRSKFFLEFVDAARGVNEFQLSGIERMTVAANVDLQFRSHTAGGEGISATTGNGGFLVIWVNAVFHGSFSFIV